VRAGHDQWYGEEHWEEEWEEPSSAEAWREDRKLRKERQLLEEEEAWPCPLFAPRHWPTLPPAPSHIDFEKFAPLTGQPSVGDKIAYKVLELRASWTPEPSEWRAAVVISRCDATGKLQLQPTGPSLGPGHDLSEDCIDVESHDLLDIRLVEGRSTEPAPVATGTAPSAAPPASPAAAASGDRSRSHAGPPPSRPRRREKPRAADAGVEAAPSTTVAASSSAASSSAACSPGTAPPAPSAGEYHKERAVLKQVEYYFSPENLASDSFMRGKIESDAQGFVPLPLIMSFNRMQRMRLSLAEVAQMLRGSSQLEVDADGRRVRRRPLQDGASAGGAVVTAQPDAEDASVQERKRQLLQQLGS